MVSITQVGLHDDDDELSSVLIFPICTMRVANVGKRTHSPTEGSFLVKMVGGISKIERSVHSAGRGGEQWNSVMAPLMQVLEGKK